MAGLPITVLLNKKGVTLVEVMIALVILLLVFLALMQTALVSINANMNNVFRDEAVSIAEQSMNEARIIPYDTLLPGASASVIQRNFRNIMSMNFNTNMTVATLGAAGDAKQVSIQVTWNWKGEAFSHTITTLIRRPS